MSQGKRISQLIPLTSASLETQIVGIDRGTTYKLGLSVVSNAVKDSINTLDDQRLTSLENYTASFTASTNIPNGTISSSQQINDLGFAITGSNTFTDTQTGTSFVANQLTANDRAYLRRIDGISGTTIDILAPISAAAGITGSTNFDTIVNKPALISGSSQITSFGFVSGSYETTGRGILSGSIISLLPTGVVSASSQVLGGSGVYSSSAQITEFEATGRGIISSSTQLNGTTIDNLTVTNLHTLYETSSVIYASGSNQFGDQLNDTQILSGSVQIVGGLTINGVQVSTQSFVDLSSLNNFTASFSTASLVDRLNSLESNTGSYETIGRNIISSSTQITSLGFVSGSYLTSLSGAISSSSQLTSSYDLRYTLSGSVQPLPSNLISSSTQITSFGFVSGSYEIIGRGIISSSAQLPSGTISGSSQLTSSLDARYDLSGSSPAGTISSSAQITSLGFISSSTIPVGTISSSTQISSFGFVSGSYEIIGRGIISSSLQTTNWGYTTTSSFNTFTSSYTTDSSSFNTRIVNLTVAGTPAGTISSSAQISSFGFVSGSYETTGRGIVSGSSQIISLLPTGVISGSSQLTSSFATTGSNAFNGNQIITGSLTVSSVALISSSLSIPSGSVLSLTSGSSLYIQNNGIAEITGAVNISGSFTASLQSGYAWVGNSNGVSSQFQTSSLLSTASFNSWTGSSFNTVSASLYALSASTTTSDQNISASIATLQSSLGSTSTAFSYTAVTNPTAYVLVSYPTASYNGGTFDILMVNTTNSTATSANYQFASYGVNAGISQNGKQTSGAGGPSPAMSIGQSGGNIQIKVTETGTFNIKGVARLF
jgi:hypothetical protein